MALLAGARDFKIDQTTGDVSLSAGDIALVGGVESIAQAAKISLQLFLGEWFLDEEKGVPWFEEVLVKGPNLVAVRGMFRKKLLEVPGVMDVLQLDLQLTNATRTLRVGFRCSTDVGEFAEEVTV